MNEEQSQPMDTNPNFPQHPGAQNSGPQNVAPQHTTPLNPPAKPPRSKGKLIGLVAAGLVALLVIILVGSELYIRNNVQSCLSDNIKSGTQAEKVDVSLAKTPMLLQNAGGKLPTIDIRIDGLNATPGLSAHLLLQGVQTSGENRVDDASIVGTFTAQGIKDKALATKVLTDPEVNLNTTDNQIEIKGTAVILPVTINLKPTLKDNKVVLTASKASVLGFGVPDDLAQQLITGIAGDIPAPKGLTAKDLKMTPEGITVTYTGQNVLPKDIESGSDANTGTCSAL